MNTFLVSEQTDSELKSFLENALGADCAVQTITSEEARDLLNKGKLQVSADMVLLENCQAGDVHEFTREIKAGDEDIQILVIAENGGGKLLKNSDNINFEALFIKPWQEEELLASVKSALKNREKIRNLKQKYQHQAEEAIHYQRILEYTPDWESLLDLQGNVVYASPSCEAITGYTPEEFINDPDLLRKITHPDDQESLQLHKDDCSNSNLLLKVDFRIITRQGDVRWISHICQPLYDENLEVLGRRTSNRDITDYKQAEIDIRRSRDSMEVLRRVFSLAQKKDDLEEFLEEALYVILTVPWFVFERRGGIFLWENGRLVMKAQQNFEEQMIRECLQIAPGECLCGKAALTGEIQFADRVDPRHEIQFEGMEPHGHYCIPIKSAEKIYGVLNIYLKEGHQRDSKEEEFLSSVARTLAEIVERKKVELELVESEQKFREIFEHSNDAIFLHDLEGNIIEANETACHRLGYTRQEIMEMNLADFVSPDFAKFMPERVEIILNQGQQIFESADVTRQGQVIPVEVNANIIKFGNKEVVLSIVRDITERKKAEEILRRMNEELENRVQERTEELNDLNEELSAERAQMLSIFDSINEIIYVSDPHTYEILFVNQYLKDILGIDPVGKLCYRELQNRDTPCSFCTNSIIMQNEGEPYQWEYYNPYLEKYFMITDRIIKWQDGRDVRFEIAIDITDRKRAEEEIIKKSEDYEMVFEGTQAAMFLVKVLPDGNFQFIRNNRAHQQGTGLMSEEFEGKTPHEVLGEELGEEIARRYRYCVDSRESVAYEETLQLPRGEKTWFTTLTPIVNEEGKVTHLVGSGIDITDRKQMEEALKKANEELERSNRELEQFAYVASHDLQEPLRMVSSYTQLLADKYEGMLDDKAQKYIDYAVDGALRMQRLITDLLHYSRVGTRGQPMEDTDAHSALGEAIRNLSNLIEEHRAIVTTDDLPTVNADASQLVQVFQNLISNAIKFKGDDIPRVHVSAREEDEEWIFSVQDNGIGIDKQYQEKIFAIFQRLHSTRESSSSGIGLALCKRIVERHQGRIWFDSEPGKGTTFYFTIPKKGGGG